MRFRSPLTQIAAVGLPLIAAAAVAVTSGTASAATGPIASWEPPNTPALWQRL